MTTIVTGVRLQVESGAKFVGDLKEMRAAVAGIGDAERETAAASGQLATATGSVSASAATAASELVRAASAANENAIGLVRASGAANQYASMAAQLRAELDPMFAVQQRYDQELARADTLFEAGAISAREYAAAQKLANDNLRAGAGAIFQNSSAQEGLNRNLGLQRAGWQGVGFQLQDVFASYASGSRLTVIAAQQAGQLSSSIAMIAQASEGAGGKMGAFAAFMGGPWGIGIGVAVSILGALAVAFDDSGKEADRATDDVFDYAGGLATLTKNAKLATSAMDELRNSLAQASPASDAADKSTKVLITAGVELARINRDIAATNELLKSPTLALNGVDAGLAMVNRLAALEKQRATVQKTIGTAKADLEQIRSDGVAANLQKAAQDKLSELGKKEKAADKPKRQPADQSARRAEYSEDTAKKLGSIRDQFSDLPPAISRANNAMRELDDISSDLAARPLTPNVVALQEELARVRTVINESLTRPFEDYLQASREAAEIDRLLLQGKEDEARALQVILGLKEKQGPLDDAQINAVLATVRGERERSMVLRDQQALISANVAAVEDFRGALEGTVADALRGRFSISRVLNSIGNSYVNLVSQRLVEGMFGDTLRQLEAQATGADKVDAAGTRIAGSLDSGADAVTDFASTVRKAIGEIEGARTAAATAAQPTNLLDQVVGGMAAGSGGAAVPEATGDEIVVTANRPKKVDVSGTGAMLIDVVNQTMRRMGIEMPKVVTESLKGVFNRLEQSLPNALQGAFTGAAASKMILGNGGSGVGGAIGGAIGQKMGEKFLSSGLEKVGGKLLGSFAGPLGGILGGVLGGALGGLLKSTKTGGASIGLDAQGNAGITGTGGNSADLKKTASGYAGTVVSALDQIAQALGADLGQFNVAIGKRSSGYIKVDSTGNVGATTAKKPGSNIIYDGKDEGEAIMAALADAISDGAIAGVSAAVQKALTSSTDVDKALKEALKVQDVEIALGGVGAQLAKEFRAFEQQAKDRVRIAREYGFDVLQMEERNAADRLKLQEKLLRDQVGGLQDLIAEMTAGSLFEGSAIDQRNKLLEEIDKTRQQAAAGEEGAADTLAQLLQKLNEVSKEAYGTTGGFAADRATILATAQAEVARAKQEIADAQVTSDPALSETNNQLGEVNDQLARLAALMGVSVDYLQAMSEQWTFIGFDRLESLASKARTS